MICCCKGCCGGGTSMSFKLLVLSQQVGLQLQWTADTMMSEAEWWRASMPYDVSALVTRTGLHLGGNTWQRWVSTLSRFKLSLVKTTTQSGVPGAQVQTWNERPGRGSIPDDAGTPGGRAAAGDGSMHPRSRRSAATARHWGQVPLDSITSEVWLSPLLCCFVEVIVCVAVLAFQGFS